MKKCVYLKIRGFVQGVNFRYYTLNYARAHQIFGYVQNNNDGTVEIVAEGEENNLKDLIEWCYNGVVMAKVTKVDAVWGKATGEFSDFRIEY